MQTVYRSLLFFKIFVLTQEFELNVNDKQRSVNLNLETVLEFNQKDNSADIQFLDNVQKFITKVRNVIDNNKVSRRDFRSGRSENLTDFIQDVIYILNTYEEPDFQDVFDILDDEIRKYHYRGCRFYELTENVDVRKLLASKFDLIRAQPISVVKGYINMLAMILKEEKYDKSVKELMDFINSLYRQDSRDKFSKVLIALEEFNKQKKKSVSDLVKIVRDGVRSIIFDHYTDLNPNARRELKTKIEAFLKQYKHQTSSTTPNVNKETAKTDKSPDVIVDTTPEPKKPDPNILKPLKKEENLQAADPEPRSGIEEEDREDRGKKEDYIAEEGDEAKESDPINSRYDDIKNDASESLDDKKESGNMRDGVKDSQEKNRVWVPMYTKGDSNENESPEEVKDDVTQKQVPRSYQKTTKTNYRTGRTFSSDEKISEDVGTVEDNSLEFQAEEQATTTHQRSATSESARFITLWEETATGGIPQYMINKMSSKKHKSHRTHKPKHKTHKKHKSHKHHESKKSKKKKHGHKPESHHNARSKKMIFYSEHNADVDVVRSTAMEFYEYKKMLSPPKGVRMSVVGNSLSEGPNQAPIPRALQQTTRYEPFLRLTLKYPTKTSPRTTPPPKKTTKRTIPTPHKFEKRYQVPSIYAGPKDYRKFGRTTQGSSEVNSYELFRKNEKKNKNTYNDSSVDVIKRIKNLEREIKEVKIKIGSAKAFDDREKKYNTKDTKDSTRDKDRKRFRILKNSSAEDKKKNKVPEKTADYNNKKLNSYAENTTVKTTEKQETTKEIKSTENPNKLFIQKKTEHYKSGKEDLRRDEGSFKLTNQDMNALPNYDERDEWKDAMKVISKNSPTKLTPKPPTTTTISTTVSTTTTLKPTTTTKKLEVFIPISITSKSTTKAATIETTTKSVDHYVPLNEISFKNTDKSLSALNVSPFAASNFLNFSDNNVAKDSVQNEVSFLLKKNNISVPTDKPDNLMPDMFSMPYKRSRKELAFTTANDEFDLGNNTSEKSGVLFTDPFRNIEDELEFLKF